MYISKNKHIKDEQKELNYLLNEWDPIGILPFEGWPDDEYECFIFPILSILHNSGNREDLKWFLKTHLTEHIWLNPPEGEYIESFIEKILVWWENKKSS